MLKKTITYTDFNGIQRSEDFYFNLTRAEIIRFEVNGAGGSLAEHLKKIVEAQDARQIINTFEKILEMAYGVKSDDGKRFIKSPQLFQEFQQTEAYSQLFYELATDDGASSAFINSLVSQATGNVPVAPQQGQDVRAQSEAAMQGHLQAQPRTEYQQPAPQAPQQSWEKPQELRIVNEPANGGLDVGFDPARQPYNQPDPIFQQQILAAQAAQQAEFNRQQNNQ